MIRAAIGTLPINVNVNQLSRQSLCGVEPAAQSTGMVLLLAPLADVMFCLGCWYFFFLDLLFPSVAFS